jgi:electron transfer flavoprotein beta subunit
MRIVVPMKLVPDLVEDLEVDSSGVALDYNDLKIKVNEYDDHALEEAILIKESTGAEVVALAVEGADVDKALFTAVAKGADRGVAITGQDPRSDNQVLAAIFAAAIAGLGADLILTGVQSVADRDGQLAPLLAARLGWPCVSVVTSVAPSGKTVSVRKEYSGGVLAELEMDLPAVLGIQAASRPPRYAPVSKVRQVEQSTSLERMEAVPSGQGGQGRVVLLKPPEKGARARMLGSAEEIVKVLKEKGVL